MKSHRRHAQIHLPPLDAGYALTLVDLFERAIAAIWRAHGERMAELAHLRPQPWPTAVPGCDDDPVTTHDIEP
jgi:hypothetical protein